jgi:hypothetical protein
MNVKKIIQEELDDAWDVFDTTPEKYSRLNIAFNPPLTEEEYIKLIPKLYEMGVRKWGGGNQYLPNYIPVNDISVLTINDESRLLHSHSDNVHDKEAFMRECDEEYRDYEYWENGREIFDIE